MQPGEQHGDAGGEHEQQYILDGQGDLGEDAAQLRQQGVDLQQRHAGEGAAEGYQLRVLAGRQVEAGQVGGRQVLQGLRLEDHVEVGLETVPIHLAQAGDLRVAFDTADIETQLVAELQLQAFGQLGFDGNARQLAGVRSAPPIASGDQVVGWQILGPGQAQVALDGALAATFLGYQLAYRLTVDHDQTARHHGIQRGWMRR